jgi:NAD-dependent DNA ligase
LDLNNTVVSAAPALLRDTSNPLYDKKIVMTKVRDAEIIDYLAKVGGHLADAITADTFILIVKSKEDMSGKVKKAMEKGIAIMEPEEFKAKYMM